MNTKVPTGSYVPHDDSYFPSLVQTEAIEWDWYMTDEALQLAKWVADRIIHVAIHGPAVVELPSALGEGTYMSPRTVLKAMALQRRLLKKHRQPIPSQDFPLEQAA